MLQKKLGQRIADLRKDRRLTQVQFARALDYSVEFVSLVERGVNGPVRRPAGRLCQGAEGRGR